MVIIGGTDALMLLGIAFILLLTRTLDIGMVVIQLNSWLSIMAFLCIASAALAKAGAMPFHTWVPETSENALVPVVAFLPASLDKLLGIYLLIRLVGNIHNFASSIASPILLIIGSVTIVGGVMMALVQHDFKKLLGYHAVSQVGYMILGIGTGTIIGIAGGLLHMLNNTIYKSSLFLIGGSVEKRTGSTDLDNLGGLAKYMPLTFSGLLIAALAISGIPPFNGFVSKWMIYQSILDLRANGPWWVIWLVAAMFGSALTLASFMKLLHASFLSSISDRLKGISEQIKEVSWFMLGPIFILSFLCIVLGIFIFVPPVNILLYPFLGALSLPQAGIIGSWAPMTASYLLIAGLLIGVLIYWITIKSKNIIVKRPFYGGEELDEEKLRVSGTEFYYTIQKKGLLRKIYSKADNKYFDIYEIGSRITFAFSNVLKYLHNGLLHTYLAWCLVGLVVIIFLLITSVK
ncbi:MAG: proton-conducting transporter membrane subunit, partial [bacterium]